MDYKELLRAFLADVYKMQAGDITAVLDAENDTEALQALRDKDVARVTTLTKAKPGQTFQDGYKKAKSEVLTELENSLKEKYGLQDSDLTGVELVDAVVAEQTKGGKPGELTEDAVKRHPVFQQAERAHKAALKQVQDDATQKVTDLETQYKRKETFATIAGKAEEILNTLNPVFPANPKVAANLKKAFLNTLEGFEFEDQNGVILVMKDGKVYTDAHGNSVEFDTLVKENAGNYFEFKQNNGGGNAGNGKPGDQGTGGAGGTGGTAYPAGITKPKTFDELQKIVNDTNIKPDDRLVVMETWRKEQEGGTQ